MKSTMYLIYEKVQYILSMKKYNISYLRKSTIYLIYEKVHYILSMKK